MARTGPPADRSLRPRSHAVPSHAARSLAARLVVVLLCSLTFGAAGSGTAHAADGYRYWNYFHLSGTTWKFSDVGAGDYKPADGDVEGYRFGTSTTAKGVTPRADLDEVTFDTICAEKKAPAGDKRVAVVLDYGTNADADGASIPKPRGVCAVVPNKASGQQVLAEVAGLRVENQLICAIDGYPAKGCGTQVKNAKAPVAEKPVSFALPAASTGASTSEDSNATAWVVGIGLLIALLAAGAVLLNRRSRTTT